MNKQTDLLVGLTVFVVVLVAAYWAYSTCRLNKILPASHKKVCAADSFVGTMAAHPSAAGCLDPTRGGWIHNRCAYV